MPGGGVRVLLADDHKAMLEGVKRQLEGKFEVVGAVDNGKALVEATLDLDPDVLIVDIEMPILSGIEAVKLIRKSGSTAKVVFLTLFEDPYLARLCLEAGALGFVVKSRLASDLIPAIQLALPIRRLSPRNFTRFSGCTVADRRSIGLCSRSCTN